MAVITMAMPLSVACTQGQRSSDPDQEEGSGTGRQRTRSEVGHEGDCHFRECDVHTGHA